jgi:hypothetical protein
MAPPITLILEVFCVDEMSSFYRLDWPKRPKKNKGQD